MTLEAPTERKIEYLLQLPIFRGLKRLKPEALKDFNKICKEYKFERGAIIAHEGDVADSMYIVRMGELEAFHIDANRVYRRDKVYQPGEAFGDTWLFEPNVHPYTIRARRPGRLIVIPGKDFLDFLKKHKNALNVIYDHLSPEAKAAIRRSRFLAYLDQKNGRIKTAVPRRDEPSAEAETAEEEPLTFEPDPGQVKRYAKLQLMPEEVVKFDRRRSLKIMWFRVAANFFFMLLATLIPVVLTAISNLPIVWGLLAGLVLALIPLIDLLVYWIDWLNTHYVITNRHIIRHELKVFRFTAETEKIEIDKVQSVEIESPNFITQQLKIGTARITTAAQSNVIYFNNIDNPRDVQTAIDSIRARNRALVASRERAILRKSVEDYFGIPNAYDEVKDPEPPPKPKSFFKRLSEQFVRKETKEGIIYHKHPIALFRNAAGSIVLFFLLIISIYGFAFFSPFMQIPAFVGVYVILFFTNFLWFIWQFEDWRNDTFMVTNQYIFDIDRKPFGFGESRKQAELSRVENVRAIQDGILATVFNFGNVQVETAGAESAIEFENVRNPNAVQNEIFSKREKFQQKLAKQAEARRRKQNIELIDMYQQVRNQRALPEYRPLPTIEGKDEGYEEI